MQSKAAARVATLHTRGVEDIRLYDGAGTTVGGIHSLFILRGDPEDFNLPAHPVMPTVHLRTGWTSVLAASLGLIATIVIALGFSGS
jgi:formate dehydrogenase iron-sulfur subunit